MSTRLAIAILAGDEGTACARRGLSLDQSRVLAAGWRVLEDLMSPSSDEPFVRPLTPEEMEQIRGAAKDEKRLLSDTWALLRRVGRKLPFAEDVLAADGYLLLTPANFGYMSGALKHFFDSTFLAVGGALGDDGSAGSSAGSTHGRPVGLLVHGRYDVTGAVRSVLAITGALGWRQAAATVEVMGGVTREDQERAVDLGGTLAAHLIPAD